MHPEHFRRLGLPHTLAHRLHRATAERFLRRGLQRTSIFDFHEKNYSTPLIKCLLFYAPISSPEFVKELEKRLKLKFHPHPNPLPSGEGQGAEGFSPEDIFYYIYAIFHSPTYRSRYAEFLKIDFPRGPWTSNVKLFRKLCAKGQELVALHLLESPTLSKSLPGYNIKDDNLV